MSIISQRKSHKKKVAAKLGIPSGHLEWTNGRLVRTGTGEKVSDVTMTKMGGAARKRRRSS